jgi:hypothetical protein
MEKAPEDIAAKANEIYELARTSPTPIAVLSLQGTILLGSPDWHPIEVEQVGAAVLHRLIQHGWKSSKATEGPKKP